VPCRIWGSRKSCWAWALLAGLLLTSRGLGAQIQAEATARIRKSVRLVEVDVIAKDKRGNPVSGLTAKDFILLDNGNVQRISRFSVEQASSGTTESSPAPVIAPLSKQSHTFSNTHPGTVAATVILFDLLNTPAEDQVPMRAQLLQSLNHLKPETPIALLFLGDTLTVVSDFTTSSISLANEIGKGPVTRVEGFGPPITARATGNPIRDAQILKAAAQAFHADERQRVVLTLSALNLIGEQLGRMRGRKSLLWLTAGLSVSGESFAVQTAIDKLNDANVAVYSVDARGVLLDYGIGAEADTNDMTAPLKDERERVRAEVVEQIARSTGGVFYHNSNQLDRAINQAIADKNLVYTLAYYPQHDVWQGKFHKLEVKVLRPGVRLRYRAGYLATPAAEPSAPDQQQMLAAIASSPLDFSGIRFSVEIEAGRERGDSRFVLHIPADELQLSRQNETMVGAVQVWFIQKRSSGEDLVTSTAKGDFHLATDAYQTAAHQGVAVASDVKLQEAAAKIRVLLQDSTSGRIGTVDVPVDSLSAVQAR
jgi:VWFA-related protein